MAHISLRNASVDIPVYGVGGNSLKTILLRRAVGGRFANAGSNVIVRALSDVSLEIADGDRVGVIGHNGAGKTTLLRVLAGVYPPTRGDVHVDGEVSPMFNISLGMAPDATGLENIRISGALWGLTNEEIEKGVEDVVEFTELGDYLSIPVRTYSAGMMLRLSFAIATLRKPEILLLDEIIGVGDATFFKKAQARVKAMAGHSRILVVSSHSMDIIKQLCNKVLWLFQGNVVAFDDTAAVVKRYLSTSTDEGGAVPKPAVKAMDPQASVA
jgi:ABC-2 type transport system ATP-binding protein/lipopolysaccharide transport system ATP-binding protein